MNFTKHLVGIFTGHNAAKHLPEVTEAGRRDARILADAYATGFFEELGATFVTRHKGFLGIEQEVIEGEVIPKPKGRSRKA